jgi:copper chaperone CopZ
MTTTTIQVSGMTCGHCVNAVTQELQGIAGVQDVQVDLVASGTSRVVVTSAEPLPQAAVVAAIDEAGYVVVDD